MSNVVIFPLPNHRLTATALTPARARAASAVRTSAVTPAVRARAVHKIPSHQSQGMKSRCDHLAIVQASASLPTSAAIAACEGHRSMTERNDANLDGADPRLALSNRDDLVLADTPESLGQTVPSRKAIRSRDCVGPLVDNWIMGKSQTKSGYKHEFIARVAFARKARGYTQEQISGLLGIDQGTYKQYETRSLLPHELVPRFCVACGIDADWLFTGARKHSLAKEPEQPPNRAGRSRQKRAKAA